MHGGCQVFRAHAARSMQQEAYNPKHAARNMRQEARIMKHAARSTQHEACSTKHEARSMHGGCQVSRVHVHYAALGSRCGGPRVSP